jgi:hypothetical protein
MNQSQGPYSRFEAGSGEGTGIGEGQLFIVDVASKAAGTKVGSWEYVKADHSDPKAGLIGIKVVPLSPGKRAVVRGVIVVADFADYDNTAVVAMCRRRVQDWEIWDPFLGNSQNLKGNAITSQTCSCAILRRCCVACNDEYSARNGSATDICRSAVQEEE